MAVKIDKKKSDRIKEAVKKKKYQKKVVNVEEEKVKLVIFSLMKDYYAFYGDDVKEILTLGPITFVPGSPDYLLGIINVRGDIESVIDINKFIGLPCGKSTKDSRIAIASKGDIRSGILVDSVVDVVDIPKNSIKPPISTLSSSAKELVIGEIAHNKKNTTLLDVAKIFSKISI